jgi:hypothetical protein
MKSLCISIGSRRKWSLSYRLGLILCHSFSFSVSLFLYMLYICNSVGFCVFLINKLLWGFASQFLLKKKDVELLKQRAGSRFLCPAPSYPSTSTSLDPSSYLPGKITKTIIITNFSISNTLWYYEHNRRKKMHIFILKCNRYSASSAPNIRYCSC